MLHAGTVIMRRHVEVNFYFNEADLHKLIGDIVH